MATGESLGHQENIKAESVSACTHQGRTTSFVAAVSPSDSVFRLWIFEPRKTQNVIARPCHSTNTSYGLVKHIGSAMFTLGFGPDNCVQWDQV